MTRQLVLAFVLGLSFILIPVQFAQGQERSDTPTEIAETYLAAMEDSDLDRAELLFTGGSSVFESGGVEGTWQHYREHHIGPEIGQIASFAVDRGDPEEEQSADGSMAFVAWPIEYTIELKDGRVIESRGTVTFVLVKEEDQYRIRHLHWSSRRKPPVEE